MMKIQRMTFFCLIAFICFSCQNDNIYQDAGVLPASGWALDQTVYFQDTLSSRAPEKMGFEINLRHTSLYPYQNIWLYIRTKSSDGKIRSDSINWKLSEPDGLWLGTGWGSLYQIAYRLPDLEVKKTGKKRWFQIQIEHGLRDKVLMGVEDIGVRLFAIQEKDTLKSSPKR